MDKEKSGRNRTISLSEDEAGYYLGKCIDMSGGELIRGAEREAFLDSVIWGDMLKVADILPDSFVDLLIVDPPYNLSKVFGETAFKRRGELEYEAFTEDWISKVSHTLKPDATVYVCCDWESSLVIGAVLKRHFNVKNRITWQREKGRGSAGNWKNSMEDIWFATVSAKNYTFNAEAVKMRRRVLAPYKLDGAPKGWVREDGGNFRDTFSSNFWDDISVPYWSMPENTEHPTQKPEKLIAKLILASSDVGGVVFDPFLGAGTTAVAAKKLGRRYVGIESEGEYCAVAQRRLELAEEKCTIQGYCDGVFWERNSWREQRKERREKRDER